VEGGFGGRGELLSPHVLSQIVHHPIVIVVEPRLTHLMLDPLNRREVLVEIKLHLLGALDGWAQVNLEVGLRELVAKVGGGEVLEQEVIVDIG